jgi:hypothetical protein
MKLSELRTGDIVLNSKGSYGCVMMLTPFGNVIKWYQNKKGESIKKYRSFESIKEDDMTFKEDPNHGIVKVWREKEPHNLNTLYTVYDNNLIYEAVKEVTMADIEDKFGYKVKIKREG